MENIHNPKETSNFKVHIIAVAYKRLGELKVFVQSVLNQTNKNWILTVIHDGPNEEFAKIMAEYKKEADSNIEYLSTDIRYNDYGHSLREYGLKKIQGDYVLLTNADNYLIPKAIEFLNDALRLSLPDIVIYDMIHSHNMPGGRALPPYSFFQTSLQRNSIDMGAAIVKSELAQRAGFSDKSFAGDATYFEDVVRAAEGRELRVHKIPSVLFVHN